MGPVAERLFQTALTLSEDERMELAEALLATGVQSGARSFDPAWLAEIRRRSAETDAGTVQATPWPIVRERIRQRLGLRSSD